MQSIDTIQIRPFIWDDWRALWYVRMAQLVEHGIEVDPATIPVHPEHVPDTDAEWDFHEIAQVYLHLPGNFWLAWDGQHPIGMVGAQAIGQCVELRRMFVAPAYRRHGVGARLVQALLAYCHHQGAQAVELWTAAGGQGQALYTRCGFWQVAAPGSEYATVQQASHYRPDADEIRMRMDWPTG
jgi:GNAT superfamily N-acetyltransferase